MSVKSGKSLFDPEGAEERIKETFSEKAKQSEKNAERMADEQLQARNNTILGGAIEIPKNESRRAAKSTIGFSLDNDSVVKFDRIAKQQGYASRSAFMQAIINEVNSKFD